MQNIKEIIINSAKRVAVATPIIALTLATLVLGKLFLGEKLITKLLIFTFSSGVLVTGLLAYGLYLKHKTDRIRLKQQHENDKEARKLMQHHSIQIAEKSES